MILLKTIVLWKMNGDNFSYLLMFYLLGAVFQTVPTQAEFTCSSLRDDHKCSKSITDNPDATDLFFSRIFIVLLDFSAPVGRNDCHGLSLTGGILRCTGANTIRKKSNIKWQRKIKWNPWKDKIRRIGVIRELFERVRTEPKAKEHNNVVLSSRQLSSP